jgi:UDP-N-acetylglucosamine--N-acetylmuramyl-(pentapeptide) pyrophosphoryl-undecaprenol N-acetylglucosamine transferase
MSFAVVVAGGTGGHINAALAIGESLVEEGHEVLFLTGKRPLDYKLFAGRNVRHLNSRPLRTKNPVELAKNLLQNLLSFLSIFLLYLRKRPRFVIGAGGYVCGPTLLAGYLQLIPVYIIEQNAVMGLTNRILGWISTKIFVHFSQTKGLSASLQPKVRVVGNPTRKSIRPVPEKQVGPVLNVLVFGGSLGATQINDIIFDILRDPGSLKLSIHHQLGGGQSAPDIVTSVGYLPMAYIEDMQAEYEWCDVIIARAGASTVSELAIIRKPVLILPYPKATDNHQYFNAIILRQDSDFSVEVLDPAVSHAEGLLKTKEFLGKALRQELKYSRKPAAGNDTCSSILSEIRRDVKLA